MDLTNRILYPVAVEFIFLSSAHRIVSRIDMLGHKVSTGKFKKSEIISEIFSDHNAMKRKL